MNLKVWVLETRPNFLVLPVVLAVLGTSIAWHDGYFHLGHALLAFIGLLLAHISVNTFNEYFDFTSGVDLATKRTPFSGGSGVLPRGLLRPEQVLRFSIVTFLLATVAGIYFLIATGWWLLPVLLIAAVCILLYTPVILKRRWPEWSPGVGLGILPILGLYFVQTSSYTWPLLVAAIPSGILVHNLLLLNEFPDAEADKLAHKKTLPITMKKTKASIVYSVLTVVVYLWIIGWVIAGVMPAYCSIALLTLPLAIKAIRGTEHPEDMTKLLPAMANNVLVVLLTQLLLGIGYILATVFQIGT
ncbi:1,4-dihydroxy-2-naphthoate octaprenyltransferase [subsurface metagenome]